MKEELYNAEVSLLETETRCDQVYVGSILDDDFFELGLSGVLYNRSDCVDEPLEPIEYKKPLEKFEVSQIEGESYLVTYILEEKREEWTKSFRSSIWTKHNSGWKMRFHQASVIK